MSEVRQALINEREYPKKAEIVCTANIDGYTDFVFLNRYGNVHNPQTINRAIDRIVLAHNLEEMGLAEKQHHEPLLIPHFSCHNLRHTFATTMDVYVEATKDAKKKSFTELDGKIKIM